MDYDKNGSVLKHYQEYERFYFGDLGAGIQAWKLVRFKDPKVARQQAIAFLRYHKDAVDHPHPYIPQTKPITKEVECWLGDNRGGNEKQYKLSKEEVMELLHITPEKMARITEKTGITFV